MSLGASLLTLARQAIADYYDGYQPAIPIRPKALHDAGASFVTLTRHGQLRGCIGSLYAHRPLGEDVCQNACGAAFRDPRFHPLPPQELADTRIEVSLLTAPQPMLFGDEAEARALLRPGLDGVVLTAGHRRATFLPQVWQQLPQPADFLAQLKRKAGLPADYWGADISLQRYAVQKWQEPQR